MVGTLKFYLTLGIPYFSPCFLSLDLEECHPSTDSYQLGRMASPTPVSDLGPCYKSISNTFISHILNISKNLLVASTDYSKWRELLCFLIFKICKI